MSLNVLEKDQPMSMLSRRSFFTRAGAGFASLALIDLL